ncbi:MAG: pentapeptide repeat-containing protein [Mojavia pulchra JT2-VF2]|jgi:uncharacterized protein YjbI with pentapeptide repeats|uniref:Pentapeptide repeat-containing protein n=1 Tax=Mojavia pulchra JT2-VF2 TaxID=287848 RepID=A0A951UKV4_9NOST|nr:pentapeptide repeat-containing protein [Mojavia pulchra JT2-VF2]
MANAEHQVLLFLLNIKLWNLWRKIFDVKVNLSEADLRDFNLRGANFSNADLRKTDFRDANLSYIDLTGANLTGANLTGANLTEANLTEASLIGTNLTAANLFAVNLSKADLRDSDFRGANLSEADLSEAKVRGATFGRANFREANLKRADLVASFFGADFQEANLCEANLCEANLCEANLSRANLSRANLSRANLIKADLKDANLNEANLSRANLSGSQALGANFIAAKFTGACLHDWHTNSTSNLDKVICDYIYLRSGQKERRPNTGKFAPGEFSKLFQQTLETIDLIFRKCIDWDAFAYSFKKVEVENQSAQLDVQSIEKKGDSVLVVRVSASPDTDKTKIYGDFMHSYELAHKLLEAQYEAERRTKDALIANQETQIVRYEKQINRLFDIVEQQGSVQKTIAENSRKVSNYDLRNSQFAGGVVDADIVNAEQIGGDTHNPNSHERLEGV